jgi:uroporphyrinogen decarboxylase
VDKLCRLPEPELRKHVRKVLEACMPGGRYCLGSGNSVTNYVPVGNYLAMVDEGLRFGG